MTQYPYHDNVTAIRGWIASGQRTRRNSCSLTVLIGVGVYYYYKSPVRF